ncbi:4-hydroxy-tetrahydrodipicolinate synthase [Geosporobacter ferrireducens]|uniref:4-hydroxy-tetrahydrodipicolinate synthase n=1 Tax=Geosporobacter ferrireducens TaxID=1424294 RepID=A0A1D8GNX7_9FIRM|nr:4-hydroxy-tetrahydrodipicolinate synthase [Geosporobacter ferrireducens]AOT72649.1 4-hydroxy-tetrahydrodipicolinate synthase [Geosporobacter ferrireducens]MTI55053.1 4-hydroxy-tetrahydrodipicolinate synthase [Geosporobacter ferrireducens]
MIDWGRLITAMVTPFDDNMEVDYIKAVELAKKLIAEGTTALVVAGTTGEGPTLLDEEKIMLFKTLKEKVEVPIIAGVGTNSTASTIENCKKALRCGVDGLLVVVPYYNKPNQESLYAHFEAISRAVEAPLMLYNVPGRTGMNMLPETVGKLSKLENIVALKEASGNIAQLSDMIQKTSDDFLVYTGDDALTLPSLSVGAYGVVSVAAQVVGKEMKKMIDAYLDGAVDQAAQIHLKLLNVFHNLFITANPIPVKAALNMIGIKVGDPRLPLTAAQPAIKAEIQRTLREFNLV